MKLSEIKNQIISTFIKFDPEKIILFGSIIRDHRARSCLAWQTAASEAGGSVKICVPNKTCILNRLKYIRK